MTDLLSCDELSAVRFRLAQTRRLLRFCGDHGLEAEAVISGHVQPDLSSICDEVGNVLPEDADLLAFRDWQHPRLPSPS